jgi:hypothetical protein
MSEVEFPFAKSWKGGYKPALRDVARIENSISGQ